MGARIEWRGAEVSAAVHRAAVGGVADTLRAVADRARAFHPGWQSRSGEAERSIRMTTPKRVSSTRVLGDVGGFAPHFRFLERGTRHMDPSHALANAAVREAERIGHRVRAHMPRPS